MKRIILLTLVLSLSVSLIACSDTDSKLHTPSNQDSAIDNSSSMYGIQEELLGCWSTEPEYIFYEGSDEVSRGYQCNLEVYYFFGNGTFLYIKSTDYNYYPVNFGSWFAESNGTLILSQDSISSATLNKYSISGNKLTLETENLKKIELSHSNKNPYDIMAESKKHTTELNDSLK